MIDFGGFELNKSKYNLHFIIILSSYYQLLSYPVKFMID